MAYLTSNKVVHRDLAARNLLVADTQGKIKVKIAGNSNYVPLKNEDFGLSRKVTDDYYMGNSSDRPIRCSAPVGPFQFL